MVASICLQRYWHTNKGSFGKSERINNLIHFIISSIYFRLWCQNILLPLGKKIAILSWHIWRTAPYRWSCGSSSFFFPRLNSCAEEGQTAASFTCCARDSPEATPTAFQHVGMWAVDAKTRSVDVWFCIDWWVVKQLSQDVFVNNSCNRAPSTAPSMFGSTLAVISSPYTSPIVLLRASWNLDAVKYTP